MGGEHPDPSILASNSLTMLPPMSVHWPPACEPMVCPHPTLATVGAVRAVVEGDATREGHSVCKVASSGVCSRSTVGRRTLRARIAVVTAR